MKLVIISRETESRGAKAGSLGDNFRLGLVSFSIVDGNQVVLASREWSESLEMRSER